MDGAEQFLPVAKRRELEENKLKAFRIKGKHYVLVEYNGAYLCFDGLCPHAEGLLAFGQVHGKYLYCSYHQAVFDVTNGKPLPGSPTDVPLKAYEVKVDGDTVYVKLAS
jgi:nitrite reductase/ring-hydroxylating ferredoxin subunit